MGQRREEWDSLVLNRDDFWMIWNNGIREQYDENEKKVSFRKFKVLSQQLLGILTTAFERHLKIEDFTEMDLHRACIDTFDLLLYASLSLKQT